MAAPSKRHGAVLVARPTERGVPAGRDRHHHGIEPVGRPVDDLPPVVLGDDLQLAVAVQEPARRAQLLLQFGRLGQPDLAAVPPHAAVAVCGCQRTQSAMTSPLAMPLFWLVYRALKPMMLTI